MASLRDVQQQVKIPRPAVMVALGLSLLFLAYGNAASAFPHDTREQLLLWSNLALMAVLLVWAFAWARLSAGELGLEVQDLGSSATLGLGLSLLAALPPVLFIVLAPLFNGGPLELSEITDRSGAGLALFLLLRQPIGTALFEEVAFRGVLYAAWLRVGAERAAILGSATTFALWHSVITSRAVIESGVVETPILTVAGILIALVGLFVGGLLFGFLRWHTRSIAAPFMAHWLIVSLMTVAVWAVG